MIDNIVTIVAFSLAGIGAVGYMYYILKLGFVFRLERDQSIPFYNYFKLRSEEKRLIKERPDIKRMKERYIIAIYIFITGFAIQVFYWMVKGIIDKW